MGNLIERIRDSIIGAHHSIQTPLGEKPLVYADYTASGRSLSFIERYIQENVLPWYANTHTETSFTGAQISSLREQARHQIRTAINAGEDDQIIFCGSGATSAINRLIDILGLRLPHDLSIRYQLDRIIPDEERPVVFIGPYEHHSNELPWRESLAVLVSIPLTSEGLICQQQLEKKLVEHAYRRLKIGSFSAASNVTGVKTDVTAISRLLKRHGALAFWDYAAAAPYMHIDMNGEAALDAVFISPHKFIGGPETPGILVAKKSVLINTVPTVVGGGTVRYVNPIDHQYIEDYEKREEGGTPAIIGSIRAGLVFKLQQEVGLEEIERRENRYSQRALEYFQSCPELEVLGNPQLPRLPIVSLRFKYGHRDLHYGFIVALLNDLFGIQARGGCSCAGPYGHTLLGMGMHYSRAVEAEVRRGAAVLRPGWVRLNFNYFIDEDEFEFLLKAVALVAKHGWRMLPFYYFDEKRAVWCFQQRENTMAADINTLKFSELVNTVSKPQAQRRPIDKQRTLRIAEAELLRADRNELVSNLKMRTAAERLRWFVLPQEIILNTS